MGMAESCLPDPGLGVRMNVIAGGVFCAGAFDAALQADSPDGVSTRMSEWLSLVPDPMGRDYLVLKATITQGVYAVSPSDSANRAELQSRSTVIEWGRDYSYHWRIVIPPDWVNHGPTSYAVIAQMHDINAPGVGRRPAVAFEIIDNVLYCNMSNTADPFGVDVFSLPVAAGDEIEITCNVHWADGTNAPADDGVIRYYVGDALVFSATGKNTWDDGSPSEPNPPYLKTGIYQPNSADSWWVGKRLTCYHVAAMVADGFVAPSEFRNYVDTRLVSRKEIASAATL